MGSGGWVTNRVEPLPTNWNIKRKRIINKYKSICALCMRYTSKPEVDHIDGAADHTDANLRVLCPQCHATRTAAQGVAASRAKAARRYREPERHPGSM